MVHLFGHCPFIFEKNDSVFSESIHDSNMIDSIIFVFHLRTHAQYENCHIIRSLKMMDIYRKNKTVVNATVL
jgi:hypothetical protein